MIQKEQHRAGSLQPQRRVLRDQTADQTPRSNITNLPEIVVIQRVEIWVRESDTKVQADRDWFPKEHARGNLDEWLTPLVPLVLRVFVWRGLGIVGRGTSETPALLVAGSLGDVNGPLLSCSESCSESCSGWQVLADGRILPGAISTSNLRRAAVDMKRLCVVSNSCRKHFSVVSVSWSSSKRIPMLFVS